MDDRKTIEDVDPNNLQASYGTGVKLLRASIEMTDDPVTSGAIETRLPWLRPLIGDAPMEHLPVFSFKIPRYAQDRIFFIDFVRK